MMASGNNFLARRRKSGPQDYNGAQLRTIDGYKNVVSGIRPIPVPLGMTDIGASRHDLQRMDSRHSYQAPSTPEEEPQVFDDKLMASRQHQRDTMLLTQAAEQDAWAYKQIMKCGCCVAGFEWTAVSGGYMCIGGNHLITHQLLAEQRDGYYESELSNLKTRFVEHDIPRTPVWGWPIFIHNDRQWYGPKYLTHDDVAKLREQLKKRIPSRFGGGPSGPSGLVDYSNRPKNGDGRQVARGQRN